MPNSFTNVHRRVCCSVLYGALLAADLFAARAPDPFFSSTNTSVMKLLMTEGLIEAHLRDHTTTPDVVTISKVSSIVGDYDLGGMWGWQGRFRKRSDTARDEAVETKGRCGMARVPLKIGVGCCEDKRRRISRLGKFARGAGRRSGQQGSGSCLGRPACAAHPAWGVAGMDKIEDKEVRILNLIDKKPGERPA